MAPLRADREAMHMIRKGQVKRLAGSDAKGQAKFVESLYTVAALPCECDRNLRCEGLRRPHGPKRWRYSVEVMNALTISACT